MSRTEKLCQILKETRNQKERLLVTVLTGPFAGEKLLLRENEILWQSCPDGFFGRLQQSETKGCSIVRTLFAGSGKRGGAAVLGKERIFGEWIGGERHLVICGGGHVSMPVIRLGRQIGFQVTVLEDRPLFAEHARGAGADKVVCAPFSQGLEQIPGGPDTWFVIVTRGHRYDTECLRTALSKEHAYVGMMGSRKRVALVKEQLLKEGVSKELLEHVHAPIGLEIGAQTPEEIAVSIAAELIQIKNQERPSQGYPKELLEQLSRTPAVLAVVVSKKGSAPREAGTKMLVFGDGRTWGTIGGGYMEQEVLSQAQELLRAPEGRTELICVTMTGTAAEEAGMVCGGTAEVFLEVIR